MENYAYTYATSKAYPLTAMNKKDKKVHMTQLFDMIAGTSSGGLIASFLVTPSAPNSKEPKNYAGKFYYVVEKKGDDIFAPKRVSWFVLIFFSLLTLILFAGLGYCIGSF